MPLLEDLLGRGSRGCEFEAVRERSDRARGVVREGWRRVRAGWVRWGHGVSCDLDTRWSVI
jgi:hypothetical protein